MQTLAGHVILNEVFVCEGKNYSHTVILEQIFELHVSTLGTFQPLLK